MSAITNALRNALNAAPENWEIRLALLEAYLGEDQQQEAADLLHEVESLPADEKSLLNAAKCYAAVGSTADAGRILDSVLSSNPASAAAHIEKAVLADRQGEAGAAIRHFITATSLDPHLSNPELEAKYGDLVKTDEPQAEAEVEAEAEPEVEAAAAAPAPAEDEATPVTAVAAGDDDDDDDVAQAAVKIAEPDPEPEAEAEATAEPEAEAEAEPEAEMAEEPEPEPIRRILPLAAPDDETDSEAVAAVAEEDDAPAAVAAAAAEPEPAKEIASGVKTVKLAPPPKSAQPAAKVADTQVLMATEPVDDEPHPDALEADAHLDDMHLRERLEELEAKRKVAIRRDKLTSLTVTILLHVGVVLALALVVIHVPRDVPPQIVAQHVSLDEQEDIKSTTVSKTTVKTSSAATTSVEIISSANVSSLAMTNLEFDGLSAQPSVGMSFEPSMSFGDTSTSMGSKMMFGQKMEGDVLGVILDVSGSMAEYLPMVIKEVDKNFKNAPIVYVNHAEMRGPTEKIEIYPVKKEEIMAHWPKEDIREGRTPYWFLWGDLPRKAPQKSVDRLIGIFKDRPNTFIALGGTNRIGAAAEFLIEQKCDSLYIFSDWEDFVDKEYCEIIGQKLGRNKVRTYVQPAAAQTEHLHTVSVQVANRTKGREMPPLTMLLRPDSDEQVSLLAGLEDEEMVPPPEGVNFATKRETRDGPGVIKNYGYWDSGDWKVRFKDELKVVEYPNFDIVLVGPEARAFIYMKTPEGYIQNPIIFGYHSHKPYIGKDEKTHYRRRKWLRNAEEPSFDGKEFKWKMILEDEIEFEVIFWFKEDTVTGTYIAEKPPEGQSDGAFIYFRVPPLATERQDMYYSVDFPGGLSLDDLRLAMTYNVGNFYLPALAADRHEATWNRLGFKRGDNPLPYNVMYRTLPDAVREATISGPSFGPRKLQARTINNNLLLNTYTRADMELWEGFLARLVRPGDRRERLSRAEAIAFSVE